MLQTERVNFLPGFIIPRDLVNHQTTLEFTKASSHPGAEGFAKATRLLSVPNSQDISKFNLTEVAKAEE